MEPVVAGALTRIAGKSAFWILKSIVDSGSTVLEDPILDLYTSIDIGKSDVEITITHEQVVDIERFLREPAVWAVLRLSFIASIGTADVASELASYSNGTKFLELASAWCNETGQRWDGLSTEIWTLITATQGAVSQSIRNSSISDDIRDAVSRHAVFGSLASNDSPEYIWTISSIASDPARQQRIRQIISETVNVIVEVPKSKFDVHSGDESIAFSELYIDRHLTDSVDGSWISADSILLPSSSNSRIVLIGDPGVGKSTMMEWIRWKTEEQIDGSVSTVPITVPCRSLLAKPGSNLLGAIKDAAAARYVLNLSDRELNDMLAVGCVQLLVDGLDEILDKSQRERIVTQLRGMVVRFPLTSIVCTTRRTGFEVQQFEGSGYRVLSLDQYSDSQVSEYASRWFSMGENRIDHNRFIGESRALDDVRRNPLMLALLCNLYRQYDYIPQSRRDVYTRCAALMFREWDPKRGIDIPNIFKNKGEQILFAIAAMLDRKGGVGETIEETALERIISSELQNSGITAMESMQSARELIEHCSGRAWILSRVPGTRLDRAFTFTHRTFFEFFAAEAKIREINRMNAVRSGSDYSASSEDSRLSPAAKSIVEAYRRDRTSVMPELLIQAADDLMGGISPMIIGEILWESRNLHRYRASDLRPSSVGELTGLCVRLLAAAGANTEVAKKVIGAALDDWVEADSRSRQIDSAAIADFLPILDLPSGHREIFYNEVKERDTYIGAYLRRYARLDSRGEAGLFNDYWRDMAAKLPLVESQDDPTVLSFEAQIGKRRIVDVIPQIAAPSLFTIASGPGRVTLLSAFLASVEKGDSTSDLISAHFAAELIFISGDLKRLPACLSSIEVSVGARDFVSIPECISVAIAVSVASMKGYEVFDLSSEIRQCAAKMIEVGNSYEDYYGYQDGILVPKSSHHKRSFRKAVHDVARAFFPASGIDGLVSALLRRSVLLDHRGGGIGAGF